MADTREGTVLVWTCLVLALCLLATCVGKATEGVIHEIHDCERVEGGDDGTG